MHTYDLHYTDIQADATDRECLSSYPVVAQKYLINQTTLVKPSEKPVIIFFIFSIVKDAAQRRKSEKLRQELRGGNLFNDNWLPLICDKLRR